jgi:hypothetical protein
MQVRFQQLTPGDRFVWQGIAHTKLGHGIARAHHGTGPGEKADPVYTFGNNEVVDFVAAKGAPADQPLPFDPVYAYAYLKAALLTVEPNGMTDPQASYFFDWFAKIAATGNLDKLEGLLAEHRPKMMRQAMRNAAEDYDPPQVVTSDKVKTWDDKVIAAAAEFIASVHEGEYPAYYNRDALVEALRNMSMTGRDRDEYEVVAPVLATEGWIK